MAQNGFHSLIGAAAARRLWPGRVAVVLGVVLGSMLPDVDVLPSALLRVSGGRVGAELHRTFTHSLWLVALCWVAAWPVKRRWPEAGGFLGGFGLGVLAHIALDVVVWFSGVDLLWPVSRWRGWPEVNLWREVRLPAVMGSPHFISNQLAAFDAVAFAAYLGYLSRLAGPGPGRPRAARAARGIALVAAGLFPVYVVTGALLPWGPQSALVYSVSIVLFYPASVACTVALRRPLADGERGERGRGVESVEAGATPGRGSRKSASRPRANPSGSP